MVPEGFTLPSSNVKDIWNLWWFGHRSQGIQPYRQLHPFDFIEKKHKKQLTKTKAVMDRIEAVAREKGHVEMESKMQECSHERSSHVFDLSFADLLLQLYPHGQARLRVGEASIATLYDRIHGHVGRKRKRTS